MQAVCEVIVVAILVNLVAALAQFNCPEDQPGQCPEADYPNIYDCTTYWKCTSTCLASLKDCPSGLHFSPDQLRCLNPEIANCQEQPATTTTTTQATTTTSQPTTTTTQPTTTTTTPVIIVDPSIVFVGSSTNHTAPQGEAVEMPEEEVDRLNDWTQNLAFTVRTTGFYFFNLNAGFMPGKQGTLALQGQSDFQAALRHLATTNNDIDGSSRDIILYLDEGSVLYTNQIVPQGELYSTVRLETSLAVFSLHNSMEAPLSAFCAARDSSYNTPGIIDFDVLVSSSSQDWDPHSNSYVTPEAGIYLFSLSAGVHHTDGTRIQLTVDGLVEAELVRFHVDNNDDLTFARTLIINLNAGQVVQVHLVQGDLQAATRNQISFSGFLYKPKDTPKVAWSLHKTNSWDGSAALFPVDYEEVLVNEGGAYNTLNNVVTIPVSGFYYIHLGVGVESAVQANVNVKLNIDGRNLIRLRRLATNHNGRDTISRGGIYYFRQGDDLRVNCPYENAFYAGVNQQRLTSFQGLLIYSDN